MIIPMSMVLIRVHMKKKLIIWGVKESKVGSLAKNLKVGNAIKIKVSSKGLFNNNNHYILRPKRKKEEEREKNESVQEENKKEKK